MIRDVLFAYASLDSSYPVEHNLIHFPLLVLNVELGNKTAQMDYGQAIF